MQAGGEFRVKPFNRALRIAINRPPAAFAFFETLLHRLFARYRFDVSEVGL